MAPWQRLYFKEHWWHSGRAYIIIFTIARMIEKYKMNIYIYRVAKFSNFFLFFFLLFLGVGELGLTVTRNRF